MVVRGFRCSVECGCGGAHMDGCCKWVWQEGKACMKDLFLWLYLLVFDVEGVLRSYRDVFCVFLSCA